MVTLPITQLLFADLIATDAPFFHNQLKSMEKKCRVNDAQEKKAFQADLGVSSWQIWMQKGPRNEEFCIQSIETHNASAFCSTFQESIKHHPFAKELNRLFQHHLTSEYSVINPTVKVEKVLDLPIDPTFPFPGFDLCYLLPLLPHKVADHIEYCRAAMHEKREVTIAACKAFGMIEMKKWIQETPERSYILYFQKMAEPIHEGQDQFLALKENPKALQATQTLRDQTGLAFEELSPSSELISLFSMI